VSKYDFTDAELEQMLQDEQQAAERLKINRERSELRDALDDLKLELRSLVRSVGTHAPVTTTDKYSFSEAELERLNQQELIDDLRKQQETLANRLRELGEAKVSFPVPLPNVTINEVKTEAPALVLRRAWDLDVTQRQQGYMRTVVASVEGEAQYTFEIQRDSKGFPKHVTATPVEHA